MEADKEPQQPQSVEEILDKLKVRFRWSKPEPFIEDERIYFVAGKKQATTAIKKLLVDLVGADIPVNLELTNVNPQEAQNRLRKELRQRIEEL